MENKEDKRREREKNRTQIEQDLRISVECRKRRETGSIQRAFLLYITIIRLGKGIRCIPVKKG